MLGRTDSRMRMLAILLVFAVFGTAAGVRLGYWQIVRSDGLNAEYDAAIALVRARNAKTVRADIVDRDGVALARSATYDSLDAHPDIIDPEDHEEILDTLDVVIGLKPGERTSFLEALADTSDQHETLRRRLTIEESIEIKAALDDRLLPRGIALTPNATRHYTKRGGQPKTTLASHLLGYVRADGTGGEGIERYYDEQLTTADPERVDIASIDGIPGPLEGLDPPPLQLTIDAKLQKQVEKELNTVRIANKAKSVSAILMDPYSGAILAAASVPAYDANNSAAIAAEDMGSLYNRVFADQYEPGSVMKIFTATAALDLGLVTPTTIIADQRVLEFWKYKVHNSDKKSKGRLKVKDVIALSRNVATAKIAKKLAPNNTQRAARRLHDLWEKVGMTRPTGVDVGYEAPGQWYDPDERLWAPVDLANRAFGQGMAATMPQLARGIATLVNGGFLVQPHLVEDSDLARVERERVITAKVARQAQDILTHVTGSVPWYAEGSLIPGYLIGGKTGTAQIWDPDKWNKETKRRGAWKQRRFNHNFIGFVGGKRPEVVIAIRIEEPVPLKVEQGSIPLRVESYETFQMVARAAIKHLGIKKSKDPDAGRPIIGTDAAKRLDPTRDREATKKAKQEARREERQAEKLEKAKRRKDDADVAGSDPDAAAGSSGGGST